MSGVNPPGIRKSCPDICIACPDGLPAHIPSTAYIRSGGAFEDAVVRHEGHEGIDVVPIPRVGESLQDVHGDLVVRHFSSPLPDHFPQSVG
jgi:hypothetical protein